MGEEGVGGDMVGVVGGAVDDTSVPPLHIMVGEGGYTFQQVGQVNKKVANFTVGYRMCKVGR